MRHRLPCVMVLAALWLVTVSASAIADEAPAAWTEHGGQAQQYETLRRLLEKSADEKVFPGCAVRIVHRGDVVFDEAFGVSDLAMKTPFRGDRAVRIASMTKPVVATLIAVLADEGTVRFDDRVDKHLPEFKRIRVRGSDEAVDAPTIGQCLSHTAGIEADADRSGRIAITPLRERVRQIAAKGLTHKPGTRFAYSGQGYDVAARVAEAAAGKPFADLMQSKLFEPLGMKHSTFHPDEAIKRKLATAYRVADGRWTPLPSRFITRRDYINGGGGLVSTLDDLAAFFTLHADAGRIGEKRIISEDAIARMYALQPHTSPYAYGLGFWLLRLDGDRQGVVMRHGGSTGVVGHLDRSNGIIFIGLSQAGAERANPVWDEAIAIAQRAFGGR